MQDENISGWKYWFGRQVHHSVLGRVKAKLKPIAHVLSRWEPTTKLCTNCGTLHDIKLSDRRFICDCGVDMDRDIHAAQNMIAIFKLNESRHGTCRIDARGEIDKSTDSEKSDDSGAFRLSEKPNGEIHLVENTYIISK